MRRLSHIDVMVFVGWWGEKKHDRKLLFIENSTEKERES
jgi:hypothetical protein